MDLALNQVARLGLCHHTLSTLEIRPFPGRTPEETIEDNLARVRQAWESLSG